MTFHLPNEIWCKIIRYSKISTLFELRRVDTKFYDLVEQDATYQSYIEEEEKILHALGHSGSPDNTINCFCRRFKNLLNNILTKSIKFAINDKVNFLKLKTGSVRPLTTFGL